MIRVLTLAAIVAAGLLLAAPFALSSWYIEERGVEVAGRVFSKSEFVTVSNSEWRRTCRVTVTYTPRRARRLDRRR